MTLSSAGAAAFKRSLARRARIDLRSLPTAIVAGVVGGLIVLSTSISYPAVIFTGAFAALSRRRASRWRCSEPRFSARRVAVGSSYPAAIANIQIETGVVLGVISAAIADSLGGRGADAPALATLITAIVLSTLSLGVVFVALGVFRLGNVIRYIPFPVIGAFLAYIAWLLLRGGMSTMVGQPLSLSASLLLLQPRLLPYWLPGALAAIGLLSLQLVRRHYLNTPVVLVASVAVFWLGRLAHGHLRGGAADGGIRPARASAGAVVVAGRPPRRARPGPTGAWCCVNCLEVVIVWLVGMIALLVIASSLEIATRSDVDLDQELKVAGIGNLLSGLGGGLPGYQSASASLLSHYIGTRSRLVGLISAGICAMVLLLGGPLLAYVPKLLLGLVLIYLALSIAANLALDRWPKLPIADRGILLLVLLSLIWLGVRPGHRDRDHRRARGVRVQLCADRCGARVRQRRRLRKQRAAAPGAAPAAGRSRRGDPGDPAPGLSVLRLGPSGSATHRRPADAAGRDAPALSAARPRARRRRRFLDHLQPDPADRAGRPAGRDDPLVGGARARRGRAALGRARSGSPHVALSSFPIWTTRSNTPRTSCSIAWPGPRPRPTSPRAPFPCSRWARGSSPTARA